MIFDFFGWMLFAIGLGSIVLFSGWYISMRTISNKIMALAAKEFHESCDSLVSADLDDVPAEVISYLDAMNTVAADKHGPHIALSLLRTARISRSNGATSLGSNNASIVQLLSSVRPEISSLFDTAVKAWVNYMVSRNVFVGLKLMLEFRRLQTESGQLSSNYANSGLQTLPKLETKMMC